MREVEAGERFRWLRRGVQRRRRAEFAVHAGVVNRSLTEVQVKGATAARKKDEETGVGGC